MPVVDAERRARLLGVKLAALAREHLGLEGSEPAGFPGGAALGAGTRAAVLLEDAPGRGLGRALAWAGRHGATELHVLVDGPEAGDAAPAVARQAATFATPPAVWRVVGRDLVATEPRPLAAPPEPSLDALAFGPQLADAGATVVVEHGIVAGEVLGLEIARVVTDPDTGSEPRLEVGVGRHDREAFALLHGDLPTGAALRDVIGAVRRHRRAGAADHPLRRLAAERWLREVVLARPDLVGAELLERHEGPAPRPTVKDPWPAVAIGPGVVVACSVGIDPDLVPYAADARLAAGSPDARLVLLVPERDVHPSTTRAAAALAEPAEVVAAPANWRDLLPEG